MAASIASGTGTFTDPYVLTNPHEAAALDIFAQRPDDQTLDGSKWFRFAVGTRAGAWTIAIDTTPNNADLDLYGGDNSVNSLRGWKQSSRNAHGDESVTVTFLAQETGHFMLAAFGRLSILATVLTLTITAPAATVPAATVPAAPVTPPLSVSSDTIIRITSFVAPAANGAPVTGYSIRYRAGSGAWTTVSKPSLSGDYNLTGLTAGTTYSVQVAAVNSVGTGPWSPVATATTTGGVAPAVPAAPVTPPLSVSSDTIIRITSFVAPAANGAPVTGYSIRYRAGSGAWTTVSKPSLSRGYNLTGLTAGTTYSVQVAAVNSVGTGPWSPVATATTGGVAPAVDTAGTVGLSDTTPRPGGAVTATLTDPDTPTALTYQWQYRFDASESWVDTGAIGATTATLTVPPGSSVGGQYRVVISYTDNFGSQTATSGPAVVTAPPAVDTAGTVALSDTTPRPGGAVTATLTDPDTPTALTYQWQYRFDASESWVDTGAIGATTATLTVPAGTLGRRAVPRRHQLHR